MPSTRKLRGGLWFSASTGTWHFHFKTGGAPRKGDTGCPSRAQAVLWLQAYRTRLALGAVGLGEPQRAPTLAEAYEAWRVKAEGAFSASWRATVARAMALHLGELARLPVTEIGTAQVQAVVERYLAQPGHSKGGANVVLRALGAILGHAQALGHLQGRPHAVKPLRVQEKPRAPLDRKRLGALVAKLQEIGAPPQVLAMVRLMAGLGLRVDESRRARVECVNLAAKVFTPWDPTKGTKGREAVELPIPSWLLPHLAAMVGERTEGYLLAGARAEIPAQVLTYKWIVKVRGLLGWPWLTPHEIRGAYATLLSEEGVPPKVIQELMRHKSFKTTLGYIRTDHSQAREALARIGAAAGL